MGKKTCSRFTPSFLLTWKFPNSIKLKKKIIETFADRLSGAASSLEVWKTSGLEGFGEAELNSLVGAAESIHEPGNLVATLLDVSALKVDGDFASLAVGLLRGGGDDDRLVENGGDGDDVLARLEDKVLDSQVSEKLVVGIVVKGRVANVNGVV